MDGWKRIIPFRGIPFRKSTTTAVGQHALSVSECKRPYGCKKSEEWVFRPGRSGEKAVFKNQNQIST